MNTSASIKEHEDNIVKCEMTQLILRKELRETVLLLEDEKKQIEVLFAHELGEKRSSLGLLRRELLSQRRRQREEQVLELQALRDAGLPRLEALQADPSLNDHAVGEDIQSLLKQIEQRQVRKYLARFRINDCSCIGVHNSLKTSLAELGILSAEQIDENELRKVDGLKATQLTALFAWRNYLLAQATARCPKQLTGILRRRVVDRWQKRRAEVQEKMNRLESSLAEQSQRMLSNCHELKRTTILDQLSMIKDARHEVTLIAENCRSSLHVVDTKLRLLQNDFEARLNKIAALIDRESNSIRMITASNRQTGCHSKFRIPFSLHVRSGITRVIQFCQKHAKPSSEHPLLMLKAVESEGRNGDF